MYATDDVGVVFHVVKGDVRRRPRRRPRRVDRARRDRPARRRGVDRARATAAMLKNITRAITRAVPEDVREATRKKINQLKGVSDDEALVREATNADPWGPHGEQLRAIARLTLDGRWDVVWDVLRERMEVCRGEKWRQTYKALSVVEYLIANGEERIPEDVRRSRVLEDLVRFEHRDARGKDEGVNVRHRAEKIKSLIEDPESIREAREKAARNRGKYAGVSSADARHMKNQSSGGSWTTDSRVGGGSRSASASESEPASTARGEAERRTEAISGSSSHWERAPVAPSMTSHSSHSAVTAKASADSGDKAATPKQANSTPQIIFRDVPVQAPPAASPEVLSFDPPPRTSNAAVAAVKYSAGGATATPATSSIDDLLGNLGGESSIPAAPVTPAVTAASSGSQWGALDGLFSAQPTVQPAMQRAAAPSQQTDPFGAFGAPPPPQPAVGNQFGFGLSPPMGASAHVGQNAVAQSSDPFGLASFGQASPTKARQPHASQSGPDNLADLTANLGLGTKGTSQSSGVPMSPFAGGSLI